MRKLSSKTGIENASSSESGRTSYLELENKHHKGFDLKPTLIAEHIDQEYKTEYATNDHPRSQQIFHAASFDSEHQ